jgi:hypothetical protein
MEGKSLFVVLFVVLLSLSYLSFIERGGNGRAHLSGGRYDVSSLKPAMHRGRAASLTDDRPTYASDNSHTYASDYSRNTSAFWGGSNPLWNDPCAPPPIEEATHGDSAKIWENSHKKSLWYCIVDFLGTPQESVIHNPMDTQWVFSHLHLDKRTLKHCKESGWADKCKRYEQGEFEKVFRGEETNSRQRIAVFSDVVFNQNGWIKSLHKDLATVWEGCWIDNGILSDIDTSDLPHYSEVISIAEFWGKEMWHFTGEALMGLAFLAEEQVSV